MVPVGSMQDVAEHEILQEIVVQNQDKCLTPKNTPNNEGSPESFAKYSKDAEKNGKAFSREDAVVNSVDGEVGEPGLGGVEDGHLGFCEKDAVGQNRTLDPSNKIF